MNLLRLRCATASSKYMPRASTAPERQLAARLALCRVDKARTLRRQRRAKHRPTLVFPHIAARGIWADLVLDRSRIVLKIVDGKMLHTQYLIYQKPRIQGFCFQNKNAPLFTATGQLLTVKHGHIGYGQQPAAHIGHALNPGLNTGQMREDRKTG